MRIRCNLLGCKEGNEDPFCRRCDAGVYDDDYIQRGYLEPLVAAWGWLAWRVRRIFSPPRCPVCDCRLQRDQLALGLCDKEECHKAWIPF